VVLKRSSISVDYITNLILGKISQILIHTNKVYFLQRHSKNLERIGYVTYLMGSDWHYNSITETPAEFFSAALVVLG
jgi:hypothetical protein